MKKFNQIITVEVPVNSIAQQLLESLSPDFKHRDLVAETIIENALSNGGLSFIYNALSGYSNDIDFKVGDMVVCEKESVYDYKRTNAGKDEAPKYEQYRRPLGTAVVKSIDLYAPNKLELEYKLTNYKGEPVVGTHKVHHTECNKVPVSN